MSQWADLLCAMQNQEVQDTEDKPGISTNDVPTEANSKEHINLAVLNKIDESTKRVRADLVKRNQDNVGHHRQGHTTTLC